MPPNQQNYVAWNSERFISWAESIGINTVTVVKSILLSHKIEQQGYKSCVALLKLADKYSVIRVEEACKKVLSYTPNPSYKSVQTILLTGQDKIKQEKEDLKSKNENLRTKMPHSMDLQGEQDITEVRRMTNNTTVSKLYEMSLTGMADSFRDQFKDTSIHELSFEERFGLIVDLEWSRRKSNRLIKLIKSSSFRFNNASIEDIEYHADRKLDKALITKLSTCNYIQEKHNVIIMGASGNGKSYIG